MNTLSVNDSIIQDAKNIIDKVYSPLTGFFGKADFKSVLDRMKLFSGDIWSMPIVIGITENVAENLNNEKRVKLISRSDKSYAILTDIEIYSFEKKEYAEKIFGTLDNKHPSVKEIMSLGSYLLGGKVSEVKGFNNKFCDYYYTPEEMKKEFIKRDWKSVVAFQTRNVPHRGHEFLQMKALEKTDGLLVQPVIGVKKDNDFKDEYIISTYKILIDDHYPKNRAMLSVLPLKMRYAGPREALMHALIRRNYGCSHFIVGRDHAGIKDYYHPQAAQEIFNQFDKNELGIEILKYNEVVYDKAREKHAFIDECSVNDTIKFSGSELRNYVKRKKEPPAYLIRPEIYNFLVNSKNSLVDPMDKNKKNNNDQGFVLWLTGLSAAGKTTVADKVYEILGNNSIKIERLDGDIVRDYLTNLGFSKEDRDANIKRVGFIAGLLSRNGVNVIASFISPYLGHRQELRDNIDNFIEVFVDAPLEVCEERDPKGMYKKARAGEIKNFTGISDPYEPPENPEIHLNTADTTPEECAEKVLNYLKDKGFIVL